MESKWTVYVEPSGDVRLLPPAKHDIYALVIGSETDANKLAGILNANDSLKAENAELVDALKDVTNVLAQMAGVFRDAVGPQSEGLAILQAAENRARAAIAKARGEQP